MEIKIDEIYTLKSKKDLKFSIYKKKTTQEKFVVEKGTKRKVPLKQEEQVTFEDLVVSNLTIEECIRKLISFKVTDIEGTITLEDFLRTYVEEKEKFEKVISKVLNIK